MNWWKVQFLNDDVLSAEIVCPEHNPVDFVQTVYVRAESRADAKTEAYRVRNLSATRRRQLSHEAAGNCRCGRAPAPGSKRCAYCKKSDRKTKERAATRKRTGHFEPPPSKFLAYDLRQKEARLDVFRLVKAQKENAPKLFNEWLEDQIKTLEEETEPC